MTRLVAVPALLLLFGVAPERVGGQDSGTAADSTVYSGRSGDLRVRPPRFESVDVSLDARLDEPQWAEAAVLTGFTQYTPSEGAPASQETEVLVFYTPEAMYFGIRAHDVPGGVTAHWTERDRSVTDDWIRIMLDTFQDQRNAYTFFVNPLGIQSDGMWLEELEPRGGPTGPKVDLNLDYIWQSEGRVTDDGWVAEIRIPYVSIRFREQEEQAWGIQIARGVNRTGFKSSWAPITVDISNILSQSGTLAGLRGLEPQRLIELNPVVTGSRSGEVVPGEGFQRGDLDPEFGLNGRLGINQNFVLDATYNPDFSQVEADADQVELNERFALFFPEKRSFFLDGAEIYQTPQRLVHTRRIVDPVGGAKLTGKTGPYSVGYLGVVDESPTTVFGRDHDAVFNLARVRRNLGSGSSLGVLYTDRTVAGDAGHNRVLSSDLRLLFGGRYTLQTQLTGSWTRSTTVDDPGLQPFVTVQLQRSGRNFGARVRVDDIDPDFRTHAGFVPRVGDTRIQGSGSYTRFGPAGALLEAYGAELAYDGFFRHEDFWDGAGPFEWSVELRPRMQLRGDRNLTLVLRNAFFTFQAEDYAAYRILEEDGTIAPFPTPPPLRNLWGVGLVPRIRVSEALQLGGRAFLRHTPLFLEGSEGREVQLSGQVGYRPSRSLAVDLNHTFARLWRVEDDSRYSTANISRVRLQYHFTEAILARVIAQYDLERRDALRDPTTGRPILIGDEVVGPRDDGTFLTQMLVQYEPSPGTIFFVGFSRTMQGPSGYTVSDMDPVSEGLFAKVSYVFRL